MSIIKSLYFESWFLNFVSDTHPPARPFWRTIPGTATRVKFVDASFHTPDPESWYTDLALHILDQTIDTVRVDLVYDQPLDLLYIDGTHHDDGTGVLVAETYYVSRPGLTPEILIGTLKLVREFVESYHGWHVKVEIHMDSISADHIGQVGLSYRMVPD